MKKRLKNIYACLITSYDHFALDPVKDARWVRVGSVHSLQNPGQLTSLCRGGWVPYCDQGLHDRIYIVD